MSAKRPPQTIDSLRRALAEAEAVAAGIRQKLAKLEARERGDEVPVCGLDILWDAALPMSRMRSSKHRCRKAWESLPKTARPTISQAVAALKAWNKSPQWYVSDNLYAPGLHRFITDRMWESLPENPKEKLHRNMSAPKQLLKTDDEKVTDPAESARLLGITPKPAARGSHAAADIGNDIAYAMGVLSDAFNFPSPATTPEPNEQNAIHQ